MIRKIIQKIKCLLGLHSWKFPAWKAKGIIFTYCVYCKKFRVAICPSPNAQKPPNKCHSEKKIKRKEKRWN